MTLINEPRNWALLKKNAFSPIATLIYLVIGIASLLAFIWLILCIHNRQHIIIIPIITYPADYIKDRFQALLRAIQRFSVAYIPRRADAFAYDGYVRPKLLGQFMVFHKNVIYYLQYRWNWFKESKELERTWPGYPRREVDLESASVHFSDGRHGSRVRGLPRVHEVTNRPLEREAALDRKVIEEEREERERMVAELEGILGRPLEGEEWRCIEWPMRMRRERQSDAREATLTREVDEGMNEVQEEINTRSHD